MIFPFIFKSLIPLLLQIPLIGDKFAFLTQIDISININYLGMLCMIINTGYLFFCYPTNNSSQKFYSIILLILFLSLFSIYYEALAQRFITFLYSFSIPCLMIILRKLLKRNLFIFAPLITICFFLIITATYLATPSKFALFNGYFI
ncbi:hypothetical protein CQA26_04755 [Providencia rettgeri]|nr:hypothetical protein CQA26_04755 [Providencia rettgeri]